MAKRDIAFAKTAAVVSSHKQDDTCLSHLLLFFFSVSGINLLNARQVGQLDQHQSLVFLKKY
jgi:hypothetical protein